MTSFTLACLQLNTQDDLTASIAAIDRLVDEAAGKGAELIALPENCFLMELSGSGFTSPAYSEATHPGILYAREKARTIKRWLLLGSVILAAEGTEKRVNRLLLVDDTGSIAARYDKIHLFDATLSGGEQYTESARIKAGDKAVVAKTPWGGLGLSICYDVRFPQLYRHLAQSGAGMLTVPAAFTHTTGTAHWEVLLRARAIETGCFVFAPAQCGMHPGNRRTYGHAMIISPWGEILAEASEDRPEVITARIDLEKATEARQKIPSLQHDRQL